MRAPFTWLAVAVGILLVIVASAAIGNRDESGETVPAGDWAQNVCASVGVWRGALESLVEDVRTPSAVAPSGEEPQSETPQGRTGLVRSGLGRAILVTETMVKGVDNAGIPDTEQGEQSADQISSWANGALSDLDQAEESLDEEAEAIDAAVEQLAAALGAIGSVRASGVQVIVEVAATDPELADALRDSSTCTELREEAGEP